MLKHTLCRTGKVRARASVRYIFTGAFLTLTLSLSANAIDTRTLSGIAPQRQNIAALTNAESSFKARIDERTQHLQSTRERHESSVTEAPTKAIDHQSQKSNLRGTRDEAIQLAQAAVKQLARKGDYAFSDFENPEGRFQYKDLYVYVHTYDCVIMAHGHNPNVVGRDMWLLRNPNGRFSCQDVVKATPKGKSAWTNYIFEDPLTNTLAEKSSYSIGLEDYIVLVGIYPNKETP